MIDAETKSEYLAALRALPAAAERAVAGLTDAQLDAPYREGGWTSRQVIHHLADAHLNAMVRIKLALTESHPTLKPYDQDSWAVLADTRGPVATSLAVLRGVHERLAALLEAIPDADWGRDAFHPESGDLTVEDLARIYARHGAHHLESIAGLRARRGW